jgi:hypothetical protein
MRVMLNEVDTETFKLTTMEGDEYFVEPWDITICCTWTPTAELEIVTIDGQIVCKNLESDQVVRLIG